MDRRNFIQKGSALSLVTASTMALGSNIFAEPFIIKGFDKLINENGEYILPPLPYDIMP